MVRKSQRMRTPRSAAPQRLAIAAAVLLPSAIAVKISSSIAAFMASVCWKAFTALKKRSGVTAWVAAVAMIASCSKRLAV